MRFKTKEDYLKNMYLLTNEEGYISMSELGRRLEVSTPTANSMVKRLQEEGLVEYKKYKPLRLTSEGEQFAVNILRRHRIAEVFLSRIMRFSWEEVHDIAEDMEHINSDVLFERMDEMLGYPDKDPHGSPIPGKDGAMVHNAYQKLSDFRVGDSVLLCALENCTHEFLVFLNKKEIALNMEIQIDSREPFDNSMMVSYQGHSQVVLSKEICDRLLVEKK